MPTYSPDSKLRNADWPKRTPDTFADLEVEQPAEQESLAEDEEAEDE